MAVPNGKTILVVEDEAPLRLALSDALTFRGFNVLQAANGEEGLAVGKEHQPHLVLLDLIMPVMDGWVMFEKMRKESWGENIPVYLLTNVDQKQMAAKLLDKQTDYFLKSDWVLEDLMLRIEGRLGIA
jgi:DNA-binding response OmpR family regulator